MKKFRSDCPINCALDLVGDKWTLLIMRDMLVTKKQTFKEFSDSDEGIATNILSNRLALLEEHGIITKRKLPNNKKSNIYAPTQRGIDLLPIILEMAAWSFGHRANLNPDMLLTHQASVELYQQDKTAFLEQFNREFDEPVIV